MEATGRGWWWTWSKLIQMVELAWRDPPRDGTKVGEIADLVCQDEMGTQRGGQPFRRITELVQGRDSGLG